MLIDHLHFPVKKIKTEEIKYFSQGHAASNNEAWFQPRSVYSRAIALNFCYTPSLENKFSLV